MKLGKTVIILGIITLCYNSLVSQTENLYIKGVPLSDGNIISWFPLDANAWHRYLEEGYKIERFNLSVDGEVDLSTSVVLHDKLMPKDSAWFANHAADEDGIMEAVGQLLYDSTFQFEANEKMDPKEMRFNLVASETESRPNIAIAMGMLTIDSMATNQQPYRYVIYNTTTTEELGRIDLFPELGRTANMKNMPIKFKYPNDLSLSDMVRMAEPKEPNNVMAIAKAYGDSIILRWAPSNPKLWAEANKNGYQVERIELEGSVRKRFDIIKPWPKADITAAIEHDSMAMMAASNLYFTDASTAVTNEDKIALFENRWGFSLYAAERSRLAANLLGLQLIDRNVEFGKTYMYTVKTEGLDVFSSGIAEVENTYTPDTPPDNLKLISGDRVIYLAWDKSLNDAKFSSYVVERSDDLGNTWEKLTKRPLVFIENEQLPLSEYSFTDSVDINYKEFQYRVSGYNSFGDLSEPALVKGEAIDLVPPPAPILLDVVFDDTLGQAVITWEKDEIPADFEGFYIMLSDELEGNYEKVSESLTANTNSYIYKPAEGLSGNRSYYFRVDNADVNGNTSSSIAKFLNVPDLIAPKPPAVVAGEIDDDGAVEITWEHSISEDVAGYWVYFANDPNDEFTPINTEMLTTNTFTYQVEPKSLNDNIYFIVTSEDVNNNRGFASEILELARPDLVPPTRTFMLAPETKDGEIIISWKPSGSEDATMYLLEKKLYNSEENWRNIDSIPATEALVYQDTLWVLDENYEYRVRVADEVWNLSEYSVPIRANYPFDHKKAIVIDLSVDYLSDNSQVQLNWDFHELGKFLPNRPFKYTIYKSTGSDNVTFYKTVSSNQKSFLDAEITPGAMYNYAVQVAFDGGKIGEVSPQKSVWIQ